MSISALYQYSTHVMTMYLDAMTYTTVSQSYHDFVTKYVWYRDENDGGADWRKRLSHTLWVFLYILQNAI